MKTRTITQKLFIAFILFFDTPAYWITFIANIILCPVPAALNLLASYRVFQLPQWAHNTYLMFGISFALLIPLAIHAVLARKIEKA